MPSKEGLGLVRRENKSSNRYMQIQMRFKIEDTPGSTCDIHFSARIFSKVYHHRCSRLDLEAQHLRRRDVQLKAADDPAFSIFLDPTLSI